jgi:hypothetical protein
LFGKIFDGFDMGLKRDVRGRKDPFLAKTSEVEESLVELQLPFLLPQYVFKLGLHLTSVS